jgi:hypothetical protein
VDWRRDDPTLVEVCVIFKLKQTTDSYDTLCNHIRYLRAGIIGQIFWDESWKQVVTDVADHVGIDWLALLDGRRWKQLETHGRLSGKLTLAGSSKMVAHNQPRA